MIFFLIISIIWYFGHDTGGIEFKKQGFSCFRVAISESPLLYIVEETLLITVLLTRRVQCLYSDPEDRFKPLPVLARYDSVVLIQANSIQIFLNVLNLCLELF